MGAVIEGRREEAERMRGYFEVQIRFAEILADRRSRALSDTCLQVTNLHRRLGLGRPDAATPSAAWARYAEGLERCGSGADRLDWTVSFFIDAAPEASHNRRFGCFSYEMQEAETVVRIHFGNRDSDDGRGPLARAKLDRRIAELREMFGFIRAHHPDAQAVRGGSWLYNLEAYRRLFPSQYAASTFELEPVRLDGTSSWGQLLDFKGAVKPSVRQALLDKAASVEVMAPWRAFPLRARGAYSPIAHFHRFYGG